MAKYEMYGNVQGRSGGPYLDEEEVLYAEKVRAARENREPDYAGQLKSVLNISQPIVEEVTEETPVKEDTGLSGLSVFGGID